MEDTNRYNLLFGDNEKQVMTQPKERCGKCGKNWAEVDAFLCGDCEFRRHARTFLR